MEKIFVVTHDSIFHADEIFAIALIKHFLDVDVDVVRTRDKKIIDEYTNISNRWVIDVGNVYDPSKLCFDHHQDKNIFASVHMIYKFLPSQIELDMDVYDRLEPFICGISHMDTNIEAIKDWNQYNYYQEFRNLSSLIGNFNRNPESSYDQHVQFTKALSFASEILINEIYSIKQRIHQECIYAMASYTPNGIPIFPAYCGIWKHKHAFAIMPNYQGWQIIASNTTKNALPYTTDKDLIFIHDSRFMAVFKTKEAVIEYAKSIK